MAAHPSASTTVNFVLRDVEQESGTQLGEGIFGKICAVKYAGKSYVAQAFRVDWRHDLEQSLLQECHVWSIVRHPNIVQFIGVWRRESGNSFPEIVTEKVQLSLRSFMDRHNFDDISKLDLLSVFGDVSLGLWYLHVQSPPIVHCGIVPDNVLLQFSSCSHCRFCLQTTKITNVGVAKVIKLNNYSSQQISAYLPFIPPEGRNDNPQYEPSFDIFAFGALLWYSAFTQGRLPEQHTEMSENLVTMGQQLKDLQNILKVSPEDDKNLKSLVASCCNKVPSERPKIVQVSESILKLQNAKVS